MLALDGTDPLVNFVYVLICFIIVILFIHLGVVFCLIKKNLIISPFFEVFLDLIDSLLDLFINIILDKTEIFIFIFGLLFHFIEIFRLKLLLEFFNLFVNNINDMIFHLVKHLFILIIYILLRLLNVFVSLRLLSRLFPD